MTFVCARAIVPIEADAATASTVPIKRFIAYTSTGYSAAPDLRPDTVAAPGARRYTESASRSGLNAAGETTSCRFRIEAGVELSYSPSISRPVGRTLKKQLPRDGCVWEPSIDPTYSGVRVWRLLPSSS